MVIKQELFSEKALFNAIKDFSNVCDIKASRIPVGWNLMLDNCKYSRELTEKEFENYLIGLENT